MTLGMLLAIAARRWYVVLAALLLVAGLGAYFTRDDGLYSTRTVITFSVPTPELWATEGTKDRGAIAFANAVADQINGGTAPAGYASLDAPYYGAGITQGMRLALPESGGQWGVSVSRAALNIDIVSTDLAWVKARQAEMTDAVFTAAEAMQSGVAPENKIMVKVQPLTNSIEHVEPTRASMMLAVAALATVGLVTGLWGAVMWEQRAGRRRPLRGRRVPVRWGQLGEEVS